MCSVLEKSITDSVREWWQSLVGVATSELVLIIYVTQIEFIADLRRFYLPCQSARYTKVLRERPV